MRIISGLIKNLRLREPRNFHSKPMSERARSALMNTLVDVSGMRVLDTYAATGAVGLEMLSRGAKEATFVEKDPSVFEVLQENVQKAGFEQAITRKMSVSAFVATFRDERYDLVFADPPYNAINLDHLAQLTELVADDGLFVISLPFEHDPVHFDNLTFIKDARYSRLSLRYYRR